MLTRLTKAVVEPQGPALAEGNAFHKAMEDAIKGEGLPAKYRRYIPIVQQVKAAPGRKVAEGDFAVTSSFKPTGYWDGNAWFRGKLDLTILRTNSAIVIDWKTGKVKTDGDQLKLFAAATFAAYPKIDKVSTAYAWVDHNKMTTANYVRADVPGIWQEFLPRVQRLERALATGDFPPKPSGLCKDWCPVGRDKCEFSGKN